ncbi:MAG: fumarylacetoacetate hydrolase family protein [Chloroflexota bacterium]
MSNNERQRLAYQLADAWRNKATIDIKHSQLPKDRESAYAVQDEMAAQITADPKHAIVGWKVGATSPGVQQAEGYDGPIPGRIFASTVFQSPAQVPAASCPYANLEAEVAFKLNTDISLADYPCTATTLSPIIDLVLAFDITSTRYTLETKAPWDNMQNMLAGIADNGNGGAIVIGPPIEQWQHIDLMTLTIDLRLNGKPPIKNLFDNSRGHPFDAFVWTVNSVLERGFPLQKGDIVLTGSLTEPQPLQAGDEAVAQYPGLGQISVEFVSKHHL